MVISLAHPADIFEHDVGGQIFRVNFLLAFEFAPHLFGQLNRRRAFADVLLDKDGAELQLQVFFFLRRGETFEGKAALVSGSGNVAQFTVEKLIDLGAKAVTLSDSSGYIYDEEGIDRKKLRRLFGIPIKNVEIKLKEKKVKTKAQQQEELIQKVLEETNLI